MFYILIILAVVFVAVVFYLAQVVVMQLEQKSDEEVLRSKQTYQDIIDQKSKAVAAKIKLEKETAQIFTLYEMTKEITRHFDEGEAFNIFKKKLKENLSIDDCRIAESLGREDELPAGYSVFVLKSKEKDLGFLLYKGVADKDKEKFVILANQFALAFRRIKLYKEIEKMAITDALTNVYTRRYFLERFEEEIKRAAARKTRISFLMLDVDHFKKINDQYGHITGDEVLKQVGIVLKESIREIDIAGRFGGEEFCMVLPDTDAPGAILVAERIRRAVEQRMIKAYDAVVRITISIGVASFPSDGKIVEELIDKADWSLYRAKSQGRNCTVAFGMYNKP